MSLFKFTLRELRTELELFEEMALKAEESDRYDDYQTLLNTLKFLIEHRVVDLRRRIRSRMKKTLPAKQASCPHKNLRDLDIRYKAGTDERVVDSQICKDCGKTFDLRTSR